MSTANHKHSKRNPIVVIILLALLLLLILVASVTLGRYAIPWEEFWNFFVNGAGSTGDAADNIANISSTANASDANGISETTLNVLLHMRLPRVLAVILVGASLAAAGCAFQGIFKNPMVSPDLLGASAGAGFGAALGILLSLGGVGVEICAFVFGLIAVSVSYFLSAAIGRALSGVLVLVLSGMVISNLFQALISAVKFVADPNSQLPEITFWLMGGLSAVREGDLIWLVSASLIGGAGLVALRWKMNVMANGDEEAMSLGIEVKRIRLAVVAFATLLTSASVAVAGMVGWVGLIVPHLARFLVGADQRLLLPTSMLLGATFLLVVDDVCRSIYTTEIPLSILTSIIGAPLFIYLIARTRKAH